MFNKSELHRIIHRLKLKKPIDIRLTTRSAKWDADYLPRYNNRGKLASHRITVYLGNDLSRSLSALIAHELIHAWQAEKDLTEIHGKGFRKMAASVKKLTGIQKIFQSDWDT